MNYEILNKITVEVPEGYSHITIALLEMGNIRARLCRYNEGDEYRIVTDVKENGIWKNKQSLPYTKKKSENYIELLGSAIKYRREL